MLKPFCHFIATFLFLLLTLSLHAAEVVKFNEGEDGKYLAIAKDDTHEVVLNYSLCFFKKKQSIGCGLVIRISDKGYIVAMDKVTPGIKISPGDKLEVRKMARSTASKSNKLDIIATRYETERLYKSLIAGFNIISPYVRFEQMLLSWLNLGIMPTYLLSQSAGDVTLNGPGVLVTATVHPMEPMEQLWGMSGIGGVLANGKSGSISEQVLVGSAFAMGGWRFRFLDSGTFGIGAGLQTFLLPGNSPLAASYQPFQPLFMIDAGFTF